MALAHKHSGYARAPALLDGSENAQFVLDQHVVLGGAALRNIGEFFFLVQIDQDLASHRFKQSGAINFARLEDDVAIAEDGRRPPLLDVFDDLKCAGKETVGKRIVEQKMGDSEDSQVVWILAAITLQGAQVIRVTKLGS